MMDRAQHDRFNMGSHGMESNIGLCQEAIISGCQVQEEVPGNFSITIGDCDALPEYVLHCAFLSALRLDPAWLALLDASAQAPAWLGLASGGSARSGGSSRRSLRRRPPPLPGRTR